MKRIRAVALVVAVLLFTLAVGAGAANANSSGEAGTVEAISLNTEGEYANGNSSNSDISEDGRYVAFGSGATDLVPSGVDTNGVGDIYVVDRLLVTTELASVATGTNPDGSPILGDMPSTTPAITADGRYVAFQSQSITLADEDEAVEGLYTDIFVRDLWEDVLTLVSRSSGEVQGNGNSTNPSITCDDTRVYVAYQSAATNLVADDTNARPDIFVSYFDKDDPSDVSTTLVSRQDDGTQGNRNSQDPSISGDGMTVAYESRAPLDPVNDTDSTTWDIYTTEWDPEVPGSYDTNLVTGEFHDPWPSAGGTLELRNPCISADATTVSYDYVWIGTTTPSYTEVWVTEGWDSDSAIPWYWIAFWELEPPFWCEYSSLSGDGRYVAYEFEAPGWGERNIYVYDRQTESSYRVSSTFYGLDPDGAAGEHGNSAGPSITPSYGDVVPQVSFFSRATNLTYVIDGIEDTHTRRDVFVGTIDTTPTINYISPTSGPTAGGTSVYIVGTNFVGLGTASVATASYSEAGGSVVSPTFTGGGPVTFGGVDALTWQRYNGRSTMKIIATSPAHAAGTVQVQVTAAGGQTADTAADDYTYVASPVEQPKSNINRYEEDNGLILYSGDWGKGDNDSLSKKAGTSSDDQQATITITFKGTKLDWIATLGPNMGKALVSIDGGEAVLVDLYSATELYQQLVWSTGDLEYGVHTLTITFPEGADYQEGKGINLDALDVTGVLLKTEEVAKP